MRACMYLSEFCAGYKVKVSQQGADVRMSKIDVLTADSFGSACLNCAPGFILYRVDLWYSALYKTAARGATQEGSSW